MPRRFVRLVAVICVALVLVSAGACVWDGVELARKGVPAAKIPAMLLNRIKSGMGLKSITA